MFQRILAAVLALGISMTGMPQMAAGAQEEEPILSIACLSDLHNQMSLIDQPNPKDVRLRGTVSRTLQTIKEEEIDLTILCGDYTSDSSDIPEENWLQIRKLMVEATRNAFPDPENTPVLWVDGNHDYEITRKYNAGDYYTFPMKEDIGELPEEDSYYEWTEDGKFKQLAKINKKATIKKTTSKLKKGTYKFRMQSFAAYTDAGGSRQTAYSPYSKTVTVKIKK